MSRLDDYRHVPHLTQQQNRKLRSAVRWSFCSQSDRLRILTPGFHASAKEETLVGGSYLAGQQLNQYTPARKQPFIPPAPEHVSFHNDSGASAHTQVNVIVRLRARERPTTGAGPDRTQKTRKGCCPEAGGRITTTHNPGSAGDGGLYPMFAAPSVVVFQGPFNSSSTIGAERAEPKAWNSKEINLQ